MPLAFAVIGQRPKEHPMFYRPISRTSAASLLLASAVACVHARVTRFDPNFQPAQRTPASAIRFYGSTKPSCAYEELARVTAEGGTFTSWGRIVNAARNAAYDLGGDAIINVQDGSRMSGATVSQAGVVLEETSSLSGIVIRFKHVDCMD
jgi:hypothetical protein